MKTTPYNKTQQYINVSKHNTTQNIKLSCKQTILLYLKFVNPILNYNDFSKFYKIKQRIFNIHINRLEQEHIIRLKKRGKPITYQLNTSPSKIKIFEHATETEHKQVYDYLTTNDPKLENIVNIILNPKALKLLHDLQKSEQITHKYKKKPRELDHLIKYNAVKKLASISKLYTLSQNYNSQKNNIDQLYSKNNSAIFKVINNTEFSLKYNIHNIQLVIHIDGLYEDIKLSPFDKPLRTNNKPIPIMSRYKYEKNTYITAHIYPSNILVITVNCSKNPILVDNTIRLNFMLLSIFEEINKMSVIASTLAIPDYYKCDYDKFNIVNHDFSLDGLTFSLDLPKGYNISYTNQINQELKMYVKESYKHYSWLRIEQRAIKTKYTLPEFRKVIQNRELNIYLK